MAHVDETMFSCFVQISIEHCFSLEPTYKKKNVIFRRLNNKHFFFILFPFHSFFLTFILAFVRSFIRFILIYFYFMFLDYLKWQHNNTLTHVIPCPWQMAYVFIYQKFSFNLMRQYKIVPLG